MLVALIVLVPMVVGSTCADFVTVEHLTDTTATLTVRDPIGYGTVPNINFWGANAATVYENLYFSVPAGLSTANPTTVAIDTAENSYNITFTGPMGGYLIDFNITDDDGVLPDCNSQHSLGFNYPNIEIVPVAPIGRVLGENFNYIFGLQNTGSGNAYNVMAYLVPTVSAFYDANVNSYGPMDLGAGNAKNLPFNFTATACGTGVQLGIRAYYEDSDGNAAGEPSSVGTFNITGTDLVISDIDLNNLTPQEGEIVTVTVRVVNQGGVNAGAFDVTLTDAQGAVGTQTVGSLNAGNTTDLNFIWNTAGKAGIHNMSASADALGTVLECNESNNNMVQQVSVDPPNPGTYDISVTGISVPGTATAGDAVTISAAVLSDIQNLSGVTVIFRLDGGIVNTQGVNLAAGVPLTVNYGWTAAEGSHTFEVVADPGNIFIESNENNNTASGTISVSASGGSGGGSTGGGGTTGGSYAPPLPGGGGGGGGSITCIYKKGDICSDNETCAGDWLNVSNTDRCCSVECVPKPPVKTCGEQSGNICIANEICEGNILTASDSDRCCSEACEVQAQPKTECDDWIPTNECVEGKVKFTRECTTTETDGGTTTKTETKLEQVAGMCEAGEEEPIATGLFGLGANADLAIMLGLFLLALLGGASFAFFVRTKMVGKQTTLKDKPTPKFGKK